MDINMPFRIQQIDPSDGAAIYSISDANSTTPLATVIVTNTVGSGFDAGREYWRIYGNRLNTSEGLSPNSLCVTAKKMKSAEWHHCPDVPFIKDDASFVLRRDIKWTGRIGKTAKFHKPGAPDDDTHGGFVINISCKNKKWIGKMHFYRASNRPLFETIDSGSSRDFHCAEHSFTGDCSVNLPKDQILGVGRAI